MTDPTDGTGDSPDSRDLRDSNGAREGATLSASGAAHGSDGEMMTDVGDLVYTLDAAGRLTGANAALLEATGYTREEVLGEHASHLMNEADLTAGSALVGTLLADPDRDHGTFELELVTRDGTRIPYEAHVTLLSTDAGEFRGTIGVLRDITDREHREEALEALHDASRAMMTAATRHGVCEIAARASKRVLGYPITVVRLLDDGHTLVPVAMTADTCDRVGDRPAYPIHDTPAGRAFEAGESRVYDDIQDTDDDYEKGNARAAMYAPLGVHGTISIADTDTNAFDRADVGLANVLAANTETALDRVAHEERVTELHDSTRRMMSAETPEIVCEIAVETADDAFGLSISGIWLLDDAGDALRPVACTDDGSRELGDPPTFTEDNSLAWAAFAAGEIRIHDYAETTPELYNPDTELRHEIVAPLGDYGVLNVASTAEEPFRDTDVRFAKLLAANTEAALARADREERLRAREAELRRQNARLEEFASVVSHDIRNPLNVIMGNVSLARETGDVEYLKPIERAADRVNRLTTDLLTLARQGRTVEDVRELSLDPLVEDAWAAVGCESARLVCDDRLSGATTWERIEADPARLGQLLENLFSNAVEHGGPHVRVEIGPLSGAEGFYVADDGPGICPTERERVFDHDYTTSPNGIGLGLTIVETVAEAHDWGVTVTDSESGGARFELRTG